MTAWANALADAVAREPLSVGDGLSGSPVERAVLRDGRVVVVKTLVPAWDSTMQASGDDGRIHRMWEAGVFDRMPARVEHAIIGVEAAGDGWLVVMRDVSDVLLKQDRVLSRAESHQILASLCAVYNEFRGDALDYLRLCSVGEYIRRFRPGLSATVPRHPLAGAVARGWEMFWDLAPADVMAAVHTIHAQPDRFAAHFEGCEKTLVHGDLRPANFGLRPGRIVLLDWGSLTALVPPSLEFGFYLAIWARRVNADHDDIVNEFVRLSRPHSDPRVLALGLVLALAHLGWSKALVAVEADRDTRQRERADLCWWFRRVRLELDRWSLF